MTIKCNLALILAPFFVASAAFGNSLSVVECEHELSVDQVRVLREAKNGDYRFTVMEGEVNGISRTVVLMGEAHIKNDRDDELGKNVVDEFGTIGFEGAEAAKKFLAGRIFSGLVIGGYRLLEILGFKPSTIKYVLKNAPHDVSNSISIHLEKGHNFTLSERLGFLVLLADSAVNLGVATTYLAPLCLIPIGVATLDPATAAAGLIGVKVVGFSHWLLHGLATMVGYTDWIEGFTQKVLCDSRDQVMAENTMRAFQSDQQLKRLLVVVGAFHLPGIERQLYQYGFRAKDLLEQNDNAKNIRDWNTADWYYDRDFNGRNVLERLNAIGKKQEFLSAISRHDQEVWVEVRLKKVRSLLEEANIDPKTISEILNRIY